MWPDTTDPPRLFHGIDFSAAEDAGRRTWITSGIQDGNGLLIQKCCSAEVLPGSGRKRDRCLAALRDFIARQGDAALGIDFPFGLPRALVHESTWIEFVLAFPSRYPTPATFRASCFAAADRRELKRETDQHAKTPWAAYNLRLYRQTYFGITQLLRPLVEKRQMSVLPMQTAPLQRPWVLEICPASTLKEQGLHRVLYKGRTNDHWSARAEIVVWLARHDDVAIPPDVRSAVLANESGDALDSLIAAYTTYRVVAGGACLQPGNQVSALEGHVYV